MFAFPKLGDIFGAISARIKANIRTGKLLSDQIYLAVCRRMPHCNMICYLLAGARVEKIERTSWGVVVTDHNGESAQVRTECPEC
jgi:hypothetical protein